MFINKQNTRVACRDGGEIPYLSMLMYSFYLMKNVKDEDVHLYAFGCHVVEIVSQKVQWRDFVQFYQTLHQVTIYYKSTH